MENPKIYINRQIEETIFSFIPRKEVIAITGPRQVGKTTLLNYLKERLVEKNKKVKYITFEDRKERDLFDSIDDFKEIYKDYDIIIIDEFQYANNGGQKLKYLYDTSNIKFIISGSSALDLKFKTGKYMVGRMFTFNLWPFSFSEFLAFADKEIYSLFTNRFKQTSDFFSSDSTLPSFGDEISRRLEKSFEEYCVFGGYPAVVLASNEIEKRKILESVVDNYLLKEIRTLLQMTTEKELLKLTQALALQIGNLIGYNELSNITGLNYKSLLKHLEVLKETYVIELVRPFFANKRTELTKSPKIFFIDNGFRNFAVNDFRLFNQRQDIGALAENYVFMSLKRRESLFGGINFWRTKSKAEVDFVVRFKGEIFPLEVKYSQSPSVGKSLYSFIKKFSPQQAFMLTKNYLGKKRINGCLVRFIPIYFLL
jgi:predicted AAA+ superfamily ATPase